jgi:hypothetical protein
VRGLGCLLLALVGAVPAGLLALAWLLNVLYTTPGGRTTISLAFLALVAGLAALALRLAWALLRCVRGPVVRGLAGLGRARGAAGVRPRGVGERPPGTVPAVPYPYGDTGDAGHLSPGDRPPPEGDASGDRRECEGLGSTAGGSHDLDDLGESPGERPHLVARVVPYGPRDGGKQYVTGIAAKRGSGKSFLLLDLGVALLSGQRWLGFRCRHCAAVLYVDLELDGEEVARRARWLAAGRGLPGVPAGLHYLDLSGETLRIPTAEEAARLRELRRAAFGGLGAWLEVAAVWGRRWGIEHPLTLWGATAQERIVLRARRVGAQAVLVDSLTLGGGTHGGDDAGWQRLLKAMQQWGVPVIVLDHTSETGHRGMVGNWVKEGLVRSVLEVERDEATGDLTVTHSKANFAAAATAFRIRPGFRRDATGRVVAVAFTRLPAGLPPAPHRAELPPGGAPSAPAPARRPGPRALPVRHASPAGPGKPALRVVPSGSATGTLPAHDRIDAEIMAAVREGTPADKVALAAAVGYAPKTVANSLSRLRKVGVLPRPETASTGRPVGPGAGAEGTVG